MNILNIEHVSKVFGEKVVLDDVSYGVHQGDKIGIIGINGTGKSTGTPASRNSSESSDAEV